MAFQERFISTQDNRSLFLRDFGHGATSGPAVLCLAGMTRNSRDFDAFARHLSNRGRRVICPDYRGRGLSDRDPDWRNYGARTSIRDVHDCLVALNLHRVIIIGTSMGGLLGLGLAVFVPCLVAGLVLNDIGPEVEPDALADLVPYISRDRPQGNWTEAVAELKLAFPDAWFRTEEDWLEMAKGTYRRGQDGVLHFDWDVRLGRALKPEAQHSEDLWRLFRAAVALPMVLLRGEHSNMISQHSVEKMRKEKPDLVVRNIPGVGHAPTLNEPEALEAIEVFLDSL